jgi:hypothetical protein
LVTSPSAPVATAERPLRFWPGSPSKIKCPSDYCPPEKYINNQDRPLVLVIALECDDGRDEVYDEADDASDEYSDPDKDDNQGVSVHKASLDRGLRLFARFFYCGH